MQNVGLKSEIQSDIVTCRMAPGTPLQEAALSELYSCGRTKVRDALLVLASENFVVLSPNKGAIVAPLDAAQVFSIFEMRIAVEKAAAALAAERIGSEELEVLQGHRSTIQKAQETHNEELFYETDRLAHDAISKASLNILLQQQITLMRLHTRRCWYFYRARGFKEVNDYDGIIAVIDAVCEKDSEAAASAMFKHLSGLHQAFSNMLITQIKGLNHV